MKQNFVRFGIAAAMLALTLAACAPALAQSPTPPPAPSTSAGALTEVTVVMGYIPNVQFAPWY
ncbi:MAG TPA: myristoyl transferase, partial [Anaerolineae bacterium]